jgi:hypothetical protein
MQHSGMVPEKKKKKKNIVNDYELGYDAAGQPTSTTPI